MVPENKKGLHHEDGNPWKNLERATGIEPVTSRSLGKRHRAFDLIPALTKSFLCRVVRARFTATFRPGNLRPPNVHMVARASQPKYAASAEPGFSPASSINTANVWRRLYKARSITPRRRAG
jgi:hypothetical protein